MRFFKKVFLIAISAVMVTVGVIGCEKIKPSFSASRGQEQLEKILKDNAEALSPGSWLAFEIKKINYQKQLFNEYIYNVYFKKAEADRKYYFCTMNFAVGKDAEGFYARHKSTFYRPKK